ncbi:hypothetical protein PG994_005872 [Apiospora phragmitis]|uniref:FAD-binding domain-containing protein n=1 Tax=Apiospora phragmitis TaxID=2905665 RepID=A0ABR1VDF7_9PEZI
MTVDAPVLRVAIVGGGPGGLATAIALSKIPNVEVKIYEQATILREVGAGINIGTNSWNVLGLLGVADSPTTGHPEWTVLNMNGRSGEELHRRERTPDPSIKRPIIRTQRTVLQSTLLAHVPPETIQLSNKLDRLVDAGDKGLELHFKDGTSAQADLVVGADGIHSLVRDTAWPKLRHRLHRHHNLANTATCRSRPGPRPALPAHGLVALPTTHVYFSPVGAGLWEIAARAYHDPATHRASKASWGVPVANAHVESHFSDLLPDIRAALRRVPEGGWREFAAFAGPELTKLTAWDHRVVLVGDASHALSGAFGSGAGFAMEDGWVLARALEHVRNERGRALPLFERIRLPYYSHMQQAGRPARLEEIGEPSYDDRLWGKLSTDGGEDMSWIYMNDIGDVWADVLGRLDDTS